MANHTSSLYRLWQRFQDPESLSRARLHVIKAAIGHKSKADRLKAMLAVTGAVTSVEARIAGAQGAAGKLRDQGRKIHTYRSGKLFVYADFGGSDDVQVDVRDEARECRKGVFADRHPIEELPNLEGLLDEDPDR